ncbi:MAG: PAS domain-containing protein [Sulfurimonas sp.]
MENKGCAVSMKEAKFNSNELFFSITDQASTILSGNEVFVRISGYTKPELIGRYHNIIRHPDMPKIVFKTFWDFIKADKPIVAYVKNQTKEGGYYWVLAAVYPMGEHYISIRIKPNAPVFAKAREIYFRLLMSEHKDGVEASAFLFRELLAAEGFKSYEEFMSNALLAELIERKKSLLTSTAPAREGINSGLNDVLSVLLSKSNLLKEKYDIWFEKIDVFNAVKVMFEEKGVLLRLLARDIVFLSLNASVASYKVSSGGETFGVLANDIRINAKENDLLIEDIHALTQNLAHTLTEMIFTVSSICIQIEMFTYFLNETLNNSQEVSQEELYENLKTLLALIIFYTDKLNGYQNQMHNLISESLKKLEQLDKQVMYLGYIQVYGIIEAASNNDETIGFGGIFSQLKDLIRSTADEIEIMQKKSFHFANENKNLINEAKKIADYIGDIKAKKQ